MSKGRGRKVVVLCEDSQSRSFAIQALRAYGFHRNEIRIEALPSKVGGGAGHAWVVKHYPAQVKARRSTKAATSLLVHIDADDRTVKERHAQLERACKDAKVEPRSPGEAVVELVPRRNIETWIYALDEELAATVTLDEREPLPKLAHEGDCRGAARAFAEHARDHTEPETVAQVPSLVDGFEEFRRIVPTE